MSSSINPREVLAQLNELGYQNISAQQLKEFIIDLKKLIKHEEAPTSNIENVPPMAIPTRHACCQARAPTKKTVRKESVVSIKFKSGNNETKATNCPVPYIQTIASRNNESKATNGHIPNIQTVNQESSTSKTFTNSVGVSTSEHLNASRSDFQKSQKTRVQFDGNVFISRSSYIIPRNPMKLCKSDPVALFHKYQEGWKKHKLPGEDNRANLRWAIRERMMGQPRALSVSAAPSMELLARNRRATSRI